MVLPRDIRSVALATLLSGVAAPAWAGLEICNDTAAPHEVAVGYKHNGDWVSQGWWTLDPATCATPIESDLKYRFYYYVSKSPGTDFRHDQLPFCTGRDPFRIDGDYECEARGYDKTYFAKIDTGGETKNHRQNLSEHSRSADAGALSDGDLAPGTWGAPFVGPAVFSDCSSLFLGGIPYCSFVGDGQVFTVIDDNRTPDEVLAQLRWMARGTPVEIEGDWVRLFDGSAEMVLRSVREREPTPEDRMLQQLQGNWFSEVDSRDQFTIQGSARQNRYGGIATSMEYLSVMQHCKEHEGQGPYLFAWDTHGGTVLCYELTEITDTALTLRYLPHGNELRYRKVD